MNAQHTERENKWPVVKVKNLVAKALAALKLSNSRSSILVSIFAYWGLVEWFFFFLFGIDALKFDIEQDSYHLALYYFINSLFPLISIAIIFTACLLYIKKSSKLQKFTCVVLLFLVLDNVAMGIDAIFNLGHWIALEKIDLFIQGDPEWVFPIGASDWVLIGICLVCLISYLQELEFV